MATDSFDKVVCHTMMLDGPEGLKLAVAYIHKHCEKQILRILRKYVPYFCADLASDLYHDVLIGLMEAVSAKKYDPNNDESDPMAFLATLARRRGCDFYRAHMKEKGANPRLLDKLNAGFKEAAEAFPALDDTEFRRYTMDAFAKAIAELPHGERIVVHAWLRVSKDSDKTAIWNEVVSDLRAQYPGTQFSVNQAQAAFTRAKAKLSSQLKALFNQ